MKGNVDAATDAREFRIYVRAFVLDGAGRILLVRKRASQRIAPGLWLLPGGAVELGEGAEDALARELREEVGVTVHAGHLWGEESRQLGATHWQGLVYVVEADVANAHNAEPEKHSDVAWCEESFARTVLSPAELRALDRSREARRPPASRIG